MTFRSETIIRGGLSRSSLYPSQSCLYAASRSFPLPLYSQAKMSLVPDIRPAVATPDDARALSRTCKCRQCGPSVQWLFGTTSRSQRSLKCDCDAARSRKLACRAICRRIAAVSRPAPPRLRFEAPASIACRNIGLRAQWQTRRLSARPTHPQNAAAVSVRMSATASTLATSAHSVGGVEAGAAGAEQQRWDAERIEDGAVGPPRHAGAFGCPAEALLGGLPRRDGRCRTLPHR